MTRLKARQPADREKQSLADYIPWLMHTSQDLVLCKDGSLLSAFEFSGVDVDDTDAIHMSEAVNDFQRMISESDERYYAWVIVDKRLKQEDRKWNGLEEGPVVKALLHSKEAAYKSGKFYELRYRLFLLFTGETGVDAFMDQVRRQVSIEGKNLPAAFLAALNPANQARSAALFDARQLDDNIRKAEAGFRKFTASSSRLKYRRLGGWEFDNALVACANISLQRNTEYRFQPDVMLDGACNLSELKFGRQVFASYGPDRNVFAAALSLSNYPGNMDTLKRILELPMEFRLVHTMHFLGEGKARKMLEEASKFWESTRSTMMQRAFAYFSGGEAEVDPGKDDLYQECLEAMRRQMAEGLGFLYHSMTLIPIGRSERAVEDAVDSIQRGLSSVALIHERLGMKSAVLSSIPGQWSLNKRLMLANAGVVALAAPTVTSHPGPDHSLHLSEAVYQRPVPPLATFASSYGTEIHFDPFVGQVGHSMLVMPTGGGKTTFVNYCLSMFTRYPNAQVIIFDRNASCRILTEQMGGAYIDLKNGPESFKLNPLSQLRAGDTAIMKIREFLLRRIEDAGDKVEAEDRKRLFDDLRTIANSGNEARISSVWSILPRNLQTLLSEWVEGGPFGYFDSTEDNFELSQWTCIEMKKIMEVERLGRAFIDHAFDVIARKLDGRPTFIYIEESSFLISNPAFLIGLDDWLKTFRKLNAMVWLTLQSPESVASIDSEAVRATLADNVPNMLLGYNPRLEFHREIYKTMFGLTDAQVSMIGKLTPKRDYLRVTGENCNLLRTNFDDHTLAYLRSEPFYQQLLDEAKKRNDTDWRDWYIKEALRRKA